MVTPQWLKRARPPRVQTSLSPSNFLLPLFVHDGDEDIPIGAMPGCSRLGWCVPLAAALRWRRKPCPDPISPACRKTGLLREVKAARAVGVNSVVIFPKTPDNLKTPTGEEAFNPNGLAQRSISLLKDTFPDLEVYTDIALDPYNTMGHDGIVRSDGVIMNDETVHYLCKQAVSQARAGADCVSPSDMMDGRVGCLRAALDAEGFTNVSIMSYTAKYASAFYGPFTRRWPARRRPAPPPGPSPRTRAPTRWTPGTTARRFARRRSMRWRGRTS